MSQAKIILFLFDSRTIQRKVAYKSDGHEPFLTVADRGEGFRVRVSTECLS